MQRNPFHKRRFHSKLKHRTKLFRRYDPRSRIRMSFTEYVTPAYANFLNAWAKHFINSWRN